MGVTSSTTTEYAITCDECGESECCPGLEFAGSKQKAIKWAGMHMTKDGVLCDKCFKDKKKVR